MLDNEEQELDDVMIRLVRFSSDKIKSIINHLKYVLERRGINVNEFLNDNE